MLDVILPQIVPSFVGWLGSEPGFLIVPTYAQPVVRNPGASAGDFMVPFIHHQGVRARSGPFHVEL